MDHLGIADRRRLRRKLTFWRIAAFAALVAAVAWVGIAGPLSSGDGPRARDHIARVVVSGLVTHDAELIERLETLRDSAAVKAVIVTIDTPGGTTYGGERLYEAVRAISEVKPVAAEIRTLAASAGYMIASAADHLVAGEASIVGSIGVIFQYGNVSELLDKIGVSVNAVKSSPLKAEPSPFGPASPEAEAMIRALVMDSYDWFVDLVEERRGLTRAETLALADGSIFTGRQALANGLVDALGAEEEVLAYFAGRDVDADLPVIEWEEPRRTSSLLFGQAMSRIWPLLTGEPFVQVQDFGGFSGGKLFLDGLVSVWQSAPPKAQDDLSLSGWGTRP